MSLKVIVHSASNLPNVDFKRASDPFVVLRFRGLEKKTPKQENTLDPSWEKDISCAAFNWPLGETPISGNDTLLIKIKDHKVVWFKRLLGQVEIPLREVRTKRWLAKRAYELEDGKHHPIPDATITLEIKYEPTSDGTGQATEKRKGNRLDDETDENQEDYEDEQESDDDDDDGTKGKGKSQKILKKKRTRRCLTRKWSDKTKDFQIRIQITEGRHLPGGEIYPMVRVTVAGERQHTTVAHSTNKPVYNKMFFFDFRGTSESELFDKPILLEVFNSKGLFRFNALLGFFKFDIGYVYERKGHCFINKWVMLCKPDGNNEEKDVFNKELTRARSPAGYLKVTAVVLGSFDKPPVGIDATRTDERDEDIDANCLIPVGVQRRSALFVLNVYQANDLPQMDAGIVMKFKSFFATLASWTGDKGKKEGHTEEDLREEKRLVDPYLTFSFSGKEVSTDVRYNNSDPEFKEVLRIPFMFPSMCERLKLQLMDWDQGPKSKHDFIGAAFLSLSSISGPGDVDAAFLPQFGPCFINFYGSPREYQEVVDEYEYLNKGVGEGVAYRGRLLVELTTKPTYGGVTHPDRALWSSKDTIRFEYYRKLSNFTLFACFHEATMVGVTNKPVEFELSMGNKGTKFDESVANSNTTPCLPIPDGSHYYYLPWGQEKPCVWIECQWEDISFRIEPLNVLNRMKESVETKLEEVMALKDDQEGSQQMKLLFENFAQTCRILLKYFEDASRSGQSGRTNTLDEEILKLRKTELAYLIEDAEAFLRKPEMEKKKESVVVELRNYIRRIKSMAIEPQLSMPDVILWMISGDKRIAYYRIPAHDILYSEKVVSYDENSKKESHACAGKFCGKVIELPLKYPGRAGDAQLKIPVLVRLELWLGLKKHQHQWISRRDGKFSVHAETYENQTRKSETVWEASKSRHWPDYSDVAGLLKFPEPFPKPESPSEARKDHRKQELFTAPKGWKFHGNWKESPSNTMRHPDENVTEFTDEVYEHENRAYPGGDWEPSEPRYVDTYGDKTTLTTDPPVGWIVPGAVPGADNAGWTVDLNRAVDEEGWEYTSHPSYFKFAPEEKAFHLSRRRRRIRLRRRKPDQEAHKDPLPTDGWEYSRSLHESFHPDEKSKDCFRRKRWLRELVPSESSKEYGWDETKLPVCKVRVVGKKGKESALCVVPRMFVTYKYAVKCQVWVSIYQARGLIAQDDTGRNDPYVRVAFINQSQNTNILPQKLCLTWDQTLIFEQVEIFGNSADLAKNPPGVVMELFDHDKGKHDFLGRCMFKPKVLHAGDQLPERKLKWHKIRRGDQDGGQILAQCELFLLNGANLPARPKKREGVYPIRDDLRPVTQKKAVEILCWGLRDLKGNSLTMLKPSVEFECNQEVIKSDEVIIDMKTCPNFSRPVLKRTILELPVDKEYSPPLSIRVYDNSWFQKSLIGLCEIPSLKKFEVPLGGQSVADGQSQDTGKQKETGKHGGITGKSQQCNEEPLNWWSKYYASRDGQATSTTSEGGKRSSTDGAPSHHIEQHWDRRYDTLTIYPDKLENVPEFEGFNDFVTTFPLRRGKTKTTKDGDTVVGHFKGAFRVINVPDEYGDVSSMARTHLPSKDPVNCLVRVYIVGASQLQPKDSDGLADPYVTVSLGDKTQGKPADHVVKTLNPQFGRMFEFKVKIPLVRVLKVQVWDYDFLPPHDLIGETEIDLEQRLLSKYHATCGVPQTYFEPGSFGWRDTLTPFQLLAKYCTLTGKELLLDKGDQPAIINLDGATHPVRNQDKMNGETPKSEEPLQRLALHLLHTECKLVPEHVETRPLYSKERPDMEQGKLQMWVDIFTEEDEKLARIDPSAMGTNQTDGTQLFTIVKKPPSYKEETAEIRPHAEDQVDGIKKYLLDQLLKPPISIAPPQPIKYELRVIIWNTTDVKLDDENFFGEKMSDIFVKAWIVGAEHKRQSTCVHERSLDGNGSFNWRMVFPLEYLPSEKKIVIREKVHYLGRDVKEEKKQPLLKIQIRDKDTFSESDFIGDRELDLSNLPRPCDHPKQCGTDKDPSTPGDREEVPTQKKGKGKFIDLFKSEMKTGWWACYAKEQEITGKVEMTLEILDEEEAKAKPVGLGQSEPNENPPLPKPIRPAHSFLWYLHPIKTFQHIIWRNNKGFFIKAVAFCLLVLMIAYFVYSIPNYAAKRVVGA